MIRTHEVAASAPAKSRRAERRRWRGWTSGLVALASIVGVALVPTLGTPPAGAAGPSLTTVAGFNGATPPTPGNPVEAGLAQVNPSYVAYNPANGDEAIASTKAGSVFVYLIAGATENNEYNIETGVGPPPVFGGLVAGDVYVVAGTGTAGLIAQPGNNQFGNSPSAVATSNPIEPTSVAFDNNGNLLIAGENTSTGKSVLQVVAETTGTFYGVSMTVGDLYTIGDVGVSGAPLTAINMGNQAAAANGMSVDTTGNIAVGDGDGVIFVNEQSSGSLSLYGTTIPHHSAKVVAGNAQGGTDCAPGATSDAANTQYFQSAAPTFDSSDNLYFTDNEAGGTNGGGCDWVEPARTGNVDGMAVTAGNVYKLAGNGGATATPDGTPGVQSNVSGTAQMALDTAGNVVLGVQSATGDGNLPAVQVLAESNGTFYGTSMTAGDVYTVAGGSGPTLGALSGPTSVLNAGGGNLLFTDGANTSANLDELSGAPSTPVLPTVSSVVPTLGPLGTSVTITGTNLNIGTATVNFGANAATGVVVNSATSITANAPAGPSGTVDVTVSTVEGTSAISAADRFVNIGPAGGTVTLKKTTSLIGNYPEQVSGTGWKADTTVSLNECATTYYSQQTCDAANQKPVTLGTGKLAGIFKGQIITLAAGVIDTNGDTCGVAGSVTCYVVVVGNSQDETASVAPVFKAPEFVTKATQKIIGNYHDPIKAGGFPIGDTIVAQECDESISTIAQIATNCDPTTDISNTASATGGAVFAPGITLHVGSAYSDSVGGTCVPGGTCFMVVTDSQNPSIILDTAISFAIPAAFLHKNVAVPVNYIDGVKGAGFPVGDTIVAQECDSAVTQANMATNCDTATQTSTTTAPNGKAVFASGVPVRETGGSPAYSDTSGGTVNPSGQAEIVITDSTNSSFYIAIPITMAP